MLKGGQATPLCTPVGELLWNTAQAALLEAAPAVEFTVVSQGHGVVAAAHNAHHHLALEPWGHHRMPENVLPVIREQAKLALRILSQPGKPSVRED